MQEAIDLPDPTYIWPQQSHLNVHVLDAAYGSTARIRPLN